MSYRDDWTKVYELWRTGESAYGEGQHRAAAELYRQATALADASEDVPTWYRGVMRRSFADELTTLERLREALAVLSEMPKTTEGGFRACCVYGSMTDQVEIALHLPVGLSAIERACEQADRYFRSAGERDWQSRLLYYRAELLYQRGLYREALAAAQEGAAYAAEGCPKLFPSTHMWGLFRIRLAQGDLADARRYMDKWVERYDREEKRGPVRGAYLYVMASRLARAEGDADEAVEWSRTGAQTLAAADWGDARFLLVCEQVRAYLLAGRHGLAGSLLARLAHARRSESGHRRYAFALLLGDYHLACARAAVGLPSLDDEFGTTGGPAREVGKSIESETARARRAYGAALKVGAWIDERLDCSVRVEEVGRRLARLSQVTRAAAAA
jgi:tetratricopeptide (TPR) repeat protein